MKKWNNKLINDFCVIDGVKPPFISTKLNKEIGTLCFWNIMKSV